MITLYRCVLNRIQIKVFGWSKNEIMKSYWINIDIVFVKSVFFAKILRPSGR